MARDRANIRVDMWADRDWRKLSGEAQLLYLLILSHPTLTYAGVAEWRPGRLAAMTGGKSPDAIQRAGAELRERLFIVVDEATEEVLVRSFVKHDGLMKQPKLAIAMTTAFAGIASEIIREVLAFEVQKLRSRQPELRGWGVLQIQTILRAAATDIRGLTPKPTPARTHELTPGGALPLGPRVGPEQPPNATHGQGLRTTTTTKDKELKNLSDGVERESETDKPKSPYSKAFEAWWLHYPKRESKGDAFRAWEVLRRSGRLPDFETLTAATETYAARMRDNPQFIKLAGGWLRDAKWEDAPAAVAVADPWLGKQRFGGPAGV